ncbi:MAG: response regulator [Burkholderiales bacterium]|nr:response regulator [Burkholderiales bacterium]MCW5604551.1 response regulator [Burkholderiales bacterium]
MGNDREEADNSLDFTAILTNPVMAKTQSWTVAEAVVPGVDRAAGPAVPPGATGTVRNSADGFRIGGDGVADRVRRLRRNDRARILAGGSTVLVVDDDFVTRKLMERLLTNDGYRVRLAGNRAEFIAALRSPPLPALVLLDVTMSDMDGFSALSSLRRHEAGKNIAVILVTARSSPEDVKRAFLLGADGYLSKPLTVRAFRSTLADLGKAG